MNFQRKNPIYKEYFLEIFYPSKSEKVKKLQNEISELKQKYTPELTDKINSLSKELRTLLNTEKDFSPQYKIEMIGIISQFAQEDTVKELLEIAQ